MKLILLYGPPASGKLTVARELVNRTGYKLLHNHQTFDLLEPVFGAYHPKFPGVLNRLRLEIVASAAAARFDGLIITHVFGAEEAQFMQDLIETVGRHGGETHFVKLVTESSELEKRVQEPSRHEFKKIRTPEELRELMDNWDVTQAVPGVDSLVIDNTNLTAEATADLILKQLGL